MIRPTSVHARSFERFVSTVPVIGTRLVSGIAYVVLPANVNREEYIKHCLSTNTICCITENSEFLKNVPIDTEILNRIEFPSDYNSFGSALVYLNIPYHSSPVIVSCISRLDQYEGLSEEESFKLQRSTQQATVSIEGKGKSGRLSIHAASSEHDEGIIDIVVSNPFSSAKLNVYSKGTIDILAAKRILVRSNESFVLEIKDATKSEKGTLISYESEKGFSYLDEFGNQFIINEKEIALSTKTKNRIIKINDTGIFIGDKETEPLLLGNKTVDLLNELLTAITQITTNTAIGPQPIINAAKFSELKGKLESLKSSTNQVS